MSDILAFFPTPIYFSKIEIPPNMVDSVISNEFEWMPNESGQYTKNKYLLEKTEYLELKNSIMSELEKYVRGVLHIKKTTEFKMTTSWGVKLSNGDYADTHTHPNFIISGVLYIKTPEGSSNIVFKNRTEMFPGFSFECDEYTEFNAGTLDVTAKEGLLVLFPSSLPHSINRNKSKEERISISFNFFPTNTIGAGEGELKL